MMDKPIAIEKRTCNENESGSIFIRLKPNVVTETILSY
jgi:hypothetical protein